MNTAQNFVLYHGGCPDGFTAAWAAWKSLGDEYKYIPVIYGKPFPHEVAAEVERGTTPIVYIIDFSYPRTVLEDLNEHAVVRVLDHHKTAEADLAGLRFCEFDMNRSGATMAWDYFHNGKVRPRIVAYAEDRDLWRWKLPYSHEVSAFMMSWEYSFEAWSRTEDQLQEDFPGVVLSGESILRSKTQMVETMAKQARMVTIAGYVVPVANATVAFSEVGNRLCQLYPDAAFSAYYFDRKDGQRHWGLRSIGDFDVSAIAAKFGGGGHRNAAGFTTPAIPTSIET